MNSDIKSRRFLRPIVAKVGLNEGFNLNDTLEETEFYGYVFKNLTIQVPNVQQRASAGPDVVRMSYKGRHQSKNVEFLNEIRHESNLSHHVLEYQEEEIAETELDGVKGFLITG